MQVRDRPCVGASGLNMLSFTTLPPGAQNTLTLDGEEALSNSHFEFFTSATTI